MSTRPTSSSGMNVGAARLSSSRRTTIRWSRPATTPAVRNSGGGGAASADPARNDRLVPPAGALLRPELAQAGARRPAGEVRGLAEPVDGLRDRAAEDARVEVGPAGILVILVA